MALDLDQRIAGIEGDLKLLKAEIKSTLIDLRDHLARKESPLGGGPDRRPHTEAVRQVSIPANSVQAATVAVPEQAAPSSGPAVQAPPAHPAFRDAAAAAQAQAAAGQRATLPAVDMGVPPAMDVGVPPAVGMGIPPAPAAPRRLRLPTAPQAAPRAAAPTAGQRQGQAPARGTATAAPAPERRPLLQHPVRTATAAGAADPKRREGSGDQSAPALGLLVGAMKWASLARAHLGPDGPKQIFEAYQAIWPVPGPVKQVVTFVIEGLPLPADPTPQPSSDAYILILLSLHGLLSGGAAIMAGVHRAEGG